MKKLERVGMEGAASGRKFKISYEGAVEDVEEVVEDEEVQLHFPDPGSFDGNICQLDRVAFAYDGTVENQLLSGVDLTVDTSSRTALLGRNGAGKSTLIKLIVGSLRPTKGDSKVNGRAKIE
jgi:ATP-binding cassette subfamily F protein 3